MIKHVKDLPPSVGEREQETGKKHTIDEPEENAESRMQREAEASRERAVRRGKKSQASNAQSPDSRLKEMQSPLSSNTAVQSYHKRPSEIDASAEFPSNTTTVDRSLAQHSIRYPNSTRPQQKQRQAKDELFSHGRVREDKGDYEPQMAILPHIGEKRKEKPRVVNGGHS